MEAAARNVDFLWGRFVAVLAVCAALGVAVVEFVRPERFVRHSVAEAEIEVPIDEQHPPTAEQVRRRALSTSNLTGVLRRLIGRDIDASATDDDEVSAATLERWRRQIVIEVRPGREANHRRVRFLAIEAASTSEAAVLVESIALQYAGEVVSDRYFARVDRLRAADERVAAATAELLEVVRSRGLTSLPTSSTVERLDRAVDPAPAELGDELQRLTQLRSRLLETLQPAHPEIAAIDARIDSLRLAASGSAIRRLSAEVESSAPRSRPLPTTGLPPLVVTAVERLNASRATAEARLNDLLDPTVVEVPMVTTSRGVGRIGELREFWYGIVCLPAVAIAWLTSRRRALRPVVVAPMMQKESSPAPVVGFTTEVAAVTDDDTLRTLEQVAEAVGAPVLGVIVRRNRRQSPTFTTK